MTQQAEQLTAKPIGGSDGRLWSSRRLQGALLVIAVVLLETLPIEAWQLILAGYSHTIARPPVPVWLLVLLPLAGYVVTPTGRGEGRRVSTGSIVAFVIVFALLLRVSPAAYAPVTRGLFDFGWLASFGGDLGAGNARFGAVVALFILSLYLWWRGSRLKTLRLDTQDTLQRFKYGMAIVTVAAVVALTLDANQKSVALGALALLLPLEVFVGLVGTSLARVQHLRMQRASASQAGAEAQWLRVTFGFAGLLVAFALVVSLIINYQAVGSLLTHFGPVGQFIIWLVTLLASVFVHVLAFIFNPIVTLLQHAIGHAAKPGQPAVQGVSCIPGPNLKCRTNTQPQDNVSPLARLLMELILLVVASGAFIFVMRLFFLRNGVERDTDMGEDEREALDARGLFRAQLRAMLHNFGRRDEEEEPERLPRDSVRYAYREVLQAAAERGLQRTGNETPDEYARRLAKTAPLNMATNGEASDLATLSQAYNAARYAEREPPARERDTIRRRAMKLAQALRPPKA